MGSTFFRSVAFRRRALGLVVIGGLLAGGGAVPGHAASGSAHDFVQHFGDQLVAIINSKQSSSAKKAALEPLIQQNIDVDSIGRYCLGRYWKVATPDERAQFLQLFHKVMINAVSERMVGDYQGVTFTIGNTISQDGDELVDGVINRPGNPPANVQLEISTQSGSPKVVDLKGEGASLRLTQRGDYASYIAQNGGQVSALIKALQKQVSRND
ncbi:toluene transporter auxiliary component Ttg2D [Ameyamaea chiangmaiensis NBRC 103196]|uniref:ABC transporter substrate-binding protein n=1 Tax=Ameyamaea chiangmaiensis TaxID=442969 RepID=A0A850P8L5_9PROT|nr:ABC transporter substrate-binding protein [Ameyamaea chiangmaiensis]MBS4075806.1 ABC transporter substrate-binding protein [Ameyamaea chiangmaiensis]NVN39323.1 ABC transporter substrate-binding protein [Ameyamaea chiangmaiensis]GBQ63807.1 toluene transporter auxiliary component Ttg2D [Ameyamaea chiangmaiensis NBRC 103196]